MYNLYDYRREKYNITYTYTITINIILLKPILKTSKK